MCWSGEASFTLAAVGYTGSWWSKRKGHETFRWLPLAYFSGMELLQGFTYSVIGQCGVPENTALTQLSYVHICFQPFFANMFLLSWLPREYRERARWIWPLCAFTSACLLLMLTPVSLWGHCNPLLQKLCGNDTCSYKGEWHIAWRLALNNLDPYYLTYYLTVFFAPVVYGAWRCSVFLFLMGPAVSYLLTANKDEQPAVWCLLSIGILSATHIPFLARLLTVKRRVTR